MSKVFNQSLITIPIDRIKLGDNHNAILFNNSILTVANQIKDNSIDLIVTDPPYKTTSRGCAGNSGGMLQKDINKKGNVFEHNSTPIKEWAGELYRILKETGHCYIMTNHKNLTEYLNTLQDIGFHFIKCLIWDKGNKIMGQYYMSQFEYILFLRKGKGVKINNCGTSDLISIPNKKQKDENNKNLHDTEKPVELNKILIENSSKEGDVVLDPFMGIGACGVACKELNRNFIGVDIDEKYYKISKERIELC